MPLRDPGRQGIRLRLVARLGRQGPELLGVRAVIAESYERIHRSNLVGMGILPLQFKHGRKRREPGADRRGSLRHRGAAGAAGQGFRGPARRSRCRRRRRTARRRRSRPWCASTRRRRCSTTSMAAFCSMCCGNCWREGSCCPHTKVVVVRIQTAPSIEEKRMKTDRHWIEGPWPGHFAIAPCRAVVTGWAMKFNLGNARASTL